MDEQTKITLKKIGLTLAIALSIAGMALGTVGVAAVWMANGPLTQSALAVLAPIEVTLAQVEKLSMEASELMGGVVETVTTVRARVDDASAKVADVDRTLVAMSGIISERVGPALDLLRNSGQFVQEAADGIEKAVSKLDSLPLIEVDLPAAGKLRDVQRDVDHAVSDLEVLKEAAGAERSGPLGAAFSLVSDPVVELDQRVQEARAKVDEVHRQATETHATVVILQRRLPLWIDLASLALTFFLIWFVLSQVAVYKLCRQKLDALASGCEKSA